MPERMKCHAVLAILTAAAAATAQVTPDKTYYGIGRPIRATVKAPADLRGEATLQLLAPITGQLQGTASVTPGPVDLAGLFPDLWDTTKARSCREVRYVQLLVGEQRIGAPLILQPLAEPDYCVYIDETGIPQYRPGRGLFSGLRAYVDQQVVLDTSLGTITFALRPDQAPNTVWNFRELVKGGFYDDISIHRIVALNDNRQPFVIQAGDPNFGHAAAGVGEGGPGYQINLEKSALPHDFGVLSMARSSKFPNSGGSQFFVCLSREGTSHLDGQFTSFGQAVGGAEVIRAIAAVRVDKAGHPQDSVVIRTARLVDAPPFGEGPKPVGAPPAQPAPR